MQKIFQTLIICCISVFKNLVYCQLRQGDPIKFQTKSLQMPQCNLNQVLIEENCFNCHYSCQTCFGLGDQMCLDCNQLNHRIKDNSKCICQSNYYELADQSTCQQCHTSCQNCDGGSSNNCLSCQGNYQLIQQTCICQSKNYFNKDNMECEVCHSSCESCKGPQSTECLSCSKISQRIFINFECLCPSGYYSDSSNEICQKCHSNCLTCQTLLECLSCGKDKFLNANNSCECQNGFTMDITNQICYQCHKTCLTCYGDLFNNCLSCPINSVLKPNNLCLCDDGYYLQNDECQLCSSNCLTCLYSDTFCLSCPPGNILMSNNICCDSSNILKNGVCDCRDQRFKNLVGVCEDCPVNCLACTDANTCTECQSYYSGAICQNGCPILFAIKCNQLDKCITCTDDFNCDTTGDCVCPANRYSSAMQCLKCESFYNPKCNLCDSANCLNCVTGYYLSGFQCLQCVTNCQSCGSSSCTTCNDGFYPPTCSNCHPSCKNCNGSGINNCTDCKANALPDGSFPTTCSCVSQYYLDNDSNCQQCSSKCDQCTITSQNCTGCFPSQNRILGSSSCDCDTINGFLDIGLDICYNVNCGYGCASCSFGLLSQNVCSSCLTTGTNRQNDPANSCPCIDGFYDSSQLICQQCPQQCATCQQNDPTTIVCNTCQPNRDLSDNCRCFKGYYQSGADCLQCPQNCISCLAQDKCVQCKNQNYYITSTGYCVCQLSNYRIKESCQCLDGYYLSRQHFKCLPCNQKCKSCQITASNCLTCANSHYIPPICSCAPGFYIEKQQENLIQADFICLPCKNNCFLCNSEDECLDCSSSMMVVNNKCVCQSNYFNEPNSYNCNICSPQCQECLYHQDNCIQCSYNRVNPQLCICPIGTYEVSLISPCQNCDSQCKSCTSSSSNCQECSINRILPPTCGCQDGFFENLDFECKPCNSKCQKCINASQNCLTCSQIDAQTPNCECLDGYFYDQLQGCIKCNQRCLTCIGSDEYNCLSCDQTKLLKLQLNKCVCEQNYYYLDNQCNICTIDIYECQTNYCGDGIKQNNEECDDWNNFNRDGCSNICTIENEYSCELVQNFQLHSSIIYSQCTKCSPYCSQCKRNQCLQCYKGYFITKSYDCQKCNFHCKECKGPNQKDCLTCITGQDYGLQEKCAFCEETQGLYTKGNVCVSKCGDGIKKEDEQCDDGNIINTDGCSQFCKIEEDWGCSNQENTLSTCQKLNIPIATLQFDRPKDFYQSFRNGQILFSKPMIISDQAIISNWKQILINQNDSSYQINSTLQFNTDNQVESIILEIEIMTTIENIIYQIDFTSSIIKDGIEGFPLKTKVLSATLGKYFQLSQQTISTTKSSKQFASTVLFILGGISILGLMMGSLEFYWNVLDNLQILSYITFINVNFPYMHNQFLGIFTFARFEFTNDYFDIDVISNLDYKQNEDYPLIVEKDVESNLVINVSSIVIIWVTPVCLLIISKINLMIIQNILIKRFNIFDYPTAKNKINSIKYLALKVIYFIHHISFKYYQSFYYNIIIRIYLASLYDLNFSIFTSCYCWLWNDSPKLIDTISFLVSQLLILLQFGVLFLLSPSLKAKAYEISSNQYEQNYGSFYEGVKSNNQLNRQIQFLQPIRKMIFMGALILFYDQAIFQISLLISIQILSSIILISTNHYLNVLETVKGVIQDVGLSLSLSLILFYYAQDSFNIANQKVIEMLSYIHVGIYSVMLCTCLVIDLYQQFKIILKKYSYLKQITQICEKKSYQQNTQKNTTQNIFIDLTQENHMENQYQVQPKAKRQFTQDYVFTNLRLY